jgi:hypothetical protein
MMKRSSVSGSVVLAATGRGVGVSSTLLWSKSKQLGKMLGHKYLKAIAIVSMEKQVWNETQEGTRQEEQCWCCRNPQNYQTCFRNFAQMIPTMPMKHIYLLCQGRWLSKLKSLNSLIFKESNGLCVLCCSNMSGTDKGVVRLLGKRAKPRCFMGISLDSLPVLCYANINSWISSELFKKRREITTEILDNIIDSWELFSRTSFRFFEIYSTWISATQQHMPGTTNGHVDHKQFEDLISRKFGKVHPWSKYLPFMSNMIYFRHLANSKHQDHSELLCSLRVGDSDKADGENNTLEVRLVGNYEHVSYINNSCHCYNEN